jgi:hypothetical protein
MSNATATDSDLDIEGFLSTVVLSRGGHHSRAAGMCAIEAVSILLKRDFSDNPGIPQTVRLFTMAWNDGMRDDAERTRLLRPHLMSICSIAEPPPAPEELEHRRSLRALNWLIREYTPTWLDLEPSLAEHAAKLRGLPEISDANAAEAGVVVRAASSAASAAYSAAESAARSAAYSAARSAAYSAARSAAYSAARSAAESAAESAARSAAESAARSAARSAATERLEATVVQLQASASALLKELVEMVPSVPEVA